jgi:glucokinase
MKEQYKNQVAQLQKLLADRNQEQAAAGSGVGLGSSSSTAEAAVAAATTEGGEGTMEKLRIRIDELEAEVLYNGQTFVSIY